VALGLTISNSLVLFISPVRHFAMAESMSDSFLTIPSVDHLVIIQKQRFSKTVLLDGRVRFAELGHVSLELL